MSDNLLNTPNDNAETHGYQSPLVNNAGMSVAFQESHAEYPGKLSNPVNRIGFIEKMGIIRLVSITFIVWAHCLLGWESGNFKTAKLRILQAIFLETGKLGTISFFIISGYFLSDRIQKYTVTSYLKHRFLKLILPWIIFLFLYVLIELFEVYPVNQIIHEKISSTLHLSLALAKSFIFYSAYWFLPMSILSILILIIFKKYINNGWFAAVLVFTTLFYCINLYFNWVPVIHTKSFMGYTFFIWLGLMVRVNEDYIKTLLGKVSWNLILPVFVMLFVISCFEAEELIMLKSADTFATIRFSNIVISIAVFFSLLKTEKLNWVNNFNPRKYIFGIYLTHCIVFSQLRIIINYFIPNQIEVNHMVYSILLQLVFFIVVFSATYFTVFIIKNSGLKFLLGL